MVSHALLDSSAYADLVGCHDLVVNPYVALTPIPHLPILTAHGIVLHAGEAAGPLTPCAAPQVLEIPPGRTAHIQCYERVQFSDGYLGWLLPLDAQLDSGQLVLPRLITPATIPQRIVVTIANLGSQPAVYRPWSPIGQLSLVATRTDHTFDFAYLEQATPQDVVHTDMDCLVEPLAYGGTLWG